MTPHRCAPSLDHLQNTFQVSLTQHQQEQVEQYLGLLRKWNSRINLTAEAPENWLQYHFFEAFWAADRFLSGFASVVDVGSGAGFPGLAFQIYQPELPITLIEPNHKRQAFLAEVCRKLGLPPNRFEGKGEEFPGWNAENQVATFRALKPGQRMLDQLKKHGAHLLVFHGSTLPFKEGPFRVVQREATPLSSRRAVSLMA